MVIEVEEGTRGTNGDRIKYRETLFRNNIKYFHFISYFLNKIYDTKYFSSYFSLNKIWRGKNKTLCI